MAFKSHVYRGHEIWIDAKRLTRQLLIKKNAKVIKKVYYLPDEGGYQLRLASKKAMDWIDNSLKPKTDGQTVSE